MVSNDGRLILPGGTLAPRRIGLFESIDANGVVRNLNLTTVAVENTGPGISDVGALAGASAGTIINVKVTSGTVADSLALSASVRNAGGLVGRNLGTIAAALPPPRR